MTPHEEFAASVRSFWAIQPHQDIISWAKENIDFSLDTSSERSRIDFDLSPFLIEPLQQWEFTGKIREVVVCGIEQHGKTLIEVIGVLYNFLDKPCSNICVYPSDDAASEINELKYEPLIRKIPQLASELERPHSHQIDHYKLGAATMYFQGAGKKIMSKSCKIRVMDEEDHYATVGHLDAAEDTRKRGRSYSESILVRVCTPTTEDGPIWKAFERGSQGYWTLRCQHCGELTMRSCDFGNFQFDTVYDEEQQVYVVVSGSERLICPACHFEHTEADKCALNRQGKYVHRFPERLDLLPSFQFGALCSQFPYMTWHRIASKILECGKRSDIKSHYELDNSFKGLPYSPRKISKEDMENLKVHFYAIPPKLEDVEMVFAVSDTQDTFSPTGVFALDCRDNLYLLKYDNIPWLWLSQAEREDIERRTGKKQTTVEDWIDAPVHLTGGTLPVLFHVVDYRGHRQQEVKDYAKSHRNVFMYAGAALRAGTWQVSKQNPRMLIVDAKSYQRTLIWQLYRQKNKTGNFLYLPEDLPIEFQQEISCVQPDKTRKSGHLMENWAPEHDAVHDCFDVLKMAYFGIDYAIATFRRERFRVGKSPALLRRWRAVDERKMKHGK